MVVEHFIGLYIGTHLTLILSKPILSVLIFKNILFVNINGIKLLVTSENRPFFYEV